MDDFLGVIGGIGPLASAYFYELLISKTEASRDQDHINTVIFSHASIPDRTSFILGKSHENPYEFLKNDVLMLSEIGAKAIVITCNTAHFFYDDLATITKTPIFNMIEDTALYLKKHRFKSVAILATSGTLESGLYQKALKKYGISFILPEESIEKRIMDLIYEKVKAGKDVSEKEWNEIIDSFKGVDSYILGCTELSTLKRKLGLKSEFIDPMEVEIDHVLEFFQKKKK